MKKIICRCDAEVEVDAPDLLDVDADPALLARLAGGDSPSATCPRCGAVVRAELPLRLRSARITSYNVCYTKLLRAEPEGSALPR